MFSVCPRLSDDDGFGLLQLVEDLSRARPLFDPREFRMLNNASLAARRESEVNNTDKEFRIRLYLQHYKPEEVKITSDKKRIIIQAKHEEKEEKHCYVSREITRVYALPEDVDPMSVTSCMNSQGILNIKADKKAIEGPKETFIPVEYNC